MVKVIILLTKGFFLTSFPKPAAKSPDRSPLFVWYSSHMGRPIARGVLSFGLVAIPVEIHTASRSENVSFNLLHAKCGSRVRNRNLCPVCNEVVERDHLGPGYELTKGQYVKSRTMSLTHWKRKGTATSSRRFAFMLSLRASIRSMIRPGARRTPSLGPKCARLQPWAPDQNRGSRSAS
jgi:hypothetical protein